MNYKPSSVNISELKVALQSIWKNMPQEPTDRFIVSITEQLRARTKVNSRHLNM